MQENIPTKIQDEKYLIQKLPLSWYTYFVNEHYIIIASDKFIKCSSNDDMLIVALT